MRYRVVKYQNKWYVEIRENASDQHPEYYGGYWAKENAEDVMDSLVNFRYPKGSLARLLWRIGLFIDALKGNVAKDRQGR